MRPDPIVGTLHANPRVIARRRQLERRIDRAMAPLVVTATSLIVLAVFNPALAGFGAACAISGWISAGAIGAVGK